LLTKDLYGRNKIICNSKNNRIVKIPIIVTEMFGDVDVIKPSDAIIVSENTFSTVVVRSAVALISPSDLP